MKDAQYYRDRLAEIEAVIEHTGRNVEQLMESRDFCNRRIIECEYQEKLAVILDSN